MDRGSSAGVSGGSERLLERVPLSRWAACGFGGRAAAVVAVTRRRLRVGHFCRRPARRRRVGRDAGHNKNEVATCAPCVCARPSRSVFSLLSKPWEQRFAMPWTRAWLRYQRFERLLH